MRGFLGDPLPGGPHEGAVGCIHPSYGGGDAMLMKDNRHRPRPALQRPSHRFFLFKQKKPLPPHRRWGGCSRGLHPPFYEGGTLFAAEPGVGLASILLIKNNMNRSRTC
nr:hypothetical protein [Morchella crassipes]